MIVIEQLLDAVRPGEAVEEELVFELFDAVPHYADYGFAVFQLSDVNPNAISGKAVTGIAADPNDSTLRRAQRARLQPW